MSPGKVQKPDLFGLALGRSSIEADSTTLTSKQSTVGASFWSGQFRWEGSHVLRAAAYSLGLLKLDSRLRKLPDIMNVKKFVTFKEFSDLLNVGVTEPVTKFAPPPDGSLEDVSRFQLTVETLLRGSDIRMKDDHQLELELGQHSTPFGKFLTSYAAVISLEEVAGEFSEAELYLLAPLSFQETLQIWSPNISVCAVEEVDVSDHATLYGFLFYSALNHRSHSNELIEKDKLDFAKQSASWSTSLAGNGIGINLTSANLISEVTKKDINDMKGTSCSLSVSHIEEIEVAVESSPRRELSEQKRASSALYPSNLQGDMEDDGKEGNTCVEFRDSKKYHNGHKSSGKRKHEADKGKKHPKRSNRSGNISQEEDNRVSHVQSKERERSSWSRTKNTDDPRYVHKQDRYSERLKEWGPYWWSKNDRNSERNRGREHSRDLHCDSEKGRKSRERCKDTDREKPWERDKGKDRGKSGKEQEKATVADRNKLGTERVSAGTKINITSGHEISSLHEHYMGKENKKRDREDDKDNHLLMSRSNETRTSFENGADQMLKDGKHVLKVKPEVEEDHCAKRTQGSRHIEPEAVSRKFGSKEVKEEAPCSFEAGAGLSLANEPEGVKHIELDNNVDNLLITDVNSMHNQTFEDVAKNHVGKLRIDLPSESIGATNVGSETLSIPMEKAGESTEVAAFRADISGDFSLAKVEDEDAYCEFSLDGIDRETRTWLTSKHGATYFEEEYGVLVAIQGERHDLDPSPKVDHQQGSLHVRITMPTSDTCDATEAKWFVNQAADLVRVVASHGVFIKCLWYEGPVQLEPEDRAPSIAAVVKKIKGEDRKNLERIQEVTGVMIGVVLRKGVATPRQEPNTIPRFIGLRLKCVRRKGLLEASKQAEALLLCVADYFSKEVAANIGTSQEIGLHHTEFYSNENSPSSRALTVIMKDLLATSPAKLEDSFSGHLHLSSGENATALATYDEPPHKILRAASASLDEETEFGFFTELGGASSKPLYVSNLPETITAPKLRSLFESVLNEKLGLGLGTNLVVAVRYIPEKYCAFIELANDTLLNEAMKLYAEDKTTFCGFKIELGLPVSSRTIRQSANVRGDIRSRSYNSDGNPEELKYVKPVSKRKSEDNARRRFAGVSSSESGSEYLRDRWVDRHDACLRKVHVLDKPKPLFLTELMRNASGQAIKQLFEDIIKKYISPSLVSSSGRQLVLDVRYVPSRGCAFVDLATPELVKFMLELHSQRPDVFHNMKMELGRRPVPHFVEDDVDRRLPMHNRDKSRTCGHVSGGNLYGHRDLTSSSQRQAERRLDASYRDYDYVEESDKGDDFSRQSGGARKRRSDPEKTVYADRLPESATESVIKRIFERVLFQHMTQEQRDVLGDDLITEVRHVPTKYCAFVVFRAEELTRLVLHLYNKDEDIFEKMRLKPHFHSRMEDLYREDLQERDDDVIANLARDRVLDHRGSHHESDDCPKSQHVELYDGRSHSSAHRVIAATAFKEVDRRRSVYVDRIPEDLSESAMRDLFEKLYRRKRRGRDLHMVSQVTFFRDKFDPKKLCAFVEVRNEDATHDLIECYNANEAAFLGMRVRPAFKYNS